MAPPSTQAAGTSATTSGKKNRRAPSATPWDDLPESQIAPSQAIVKAARDGIYSFRRERFSGDADFFNGYPRSECPHCGSAKVKRNGANRNGVQVYRRLFSVAMNPPSDKLEKAAFALDRAMRCPKTLRFRDFYNVKTRSDGSGDEN